MKIRILISAVLICLLFACSVTSTPAQEETETPVETPAETASPTETLTPTSTETPASTNTPSATPTPVNPFPNAPLCSTHSEDVFHTIWNLSGCHYDHEHGTNPFTSEVSVAFPGFNLYSLLGNVQIGHTNPSSPMENTHKHGGFKWDVMLANPHGCLGGFEGATRCVSSAVVQYHNFGDYSMEMGARVHSTAALLKVCLPSAPTNCGYIFTIQHQEYGQRTTPYQGTVIQYPDSPFPVYTSGFGQYFTVDCVFNGLAGCRTSLSQIRTSNLNTNSVWTSKPTGTGVRPAGSTIFKLLFRVRDSYQVFNSLDLTYPFTFLFVCSTDNGITYNPPNCRWNNSTSKVHEVGGTIPASWDNLSGFDTNPVVGRITAEGFTNRFGVLDQTCTQAGGDCFPIKMVDMFTGFYGDYLTLNKTTNTTTVSNPERDIYFCDGVVCSELSAGGVPSGWIGSEN